MTAATFRRLVPVAAAAALLIVPATSQAAFSSGDFDGDGVANAGDNCRVVANPAQEPGVGAEGAACSGANERATATALRFNYTTAQLDTIFSAIDAGPMPGNATARGWVRCRLPGCESMPANALLNDPIVPHLWVGQVWTTDASGGTLINRTLDDSRRDFPAVVSYGPSFRDGRPAIVVTYPSETNPYPVDHLILNCRAVQTGAYFCYVYLDQHPLPGQKLLLFNVIQDTLNPN